MINIRKITAALLAAATVFFAAGCERIVLVPGRSSGNITESAVTSEEKFSEYPVILNGTEITEAPQRIVSLTPAYTEILCEMGYSDRLVAVSDYCNYPDLISTLPKVGSSANPDIQKIAQLAPDLVITATPIVTKDTIALEENGVKILTITSPYTLEEFENIYKFFGLAFEGIFSGESKGEKAFSQIKEAMNTSQEKKRIRFIYITAALSPAGGNTFESAVLSLYGENCAASASGYDFPSQNLTENQPDIIFLSSEFTAEDLYSNDIYSSLDAVINENIIIIDNKYFERPSSRITGLFSQLDNELPDNEPEESEENNAAQESLSE